LKRKARERLSQIEARNPDAFTDNLIDWIPQVSPRLERPEPFAPYCDLLQRAPHGGIRAVVAAPPQHGKTICGTHALVYILKKFPGLRNAYGTYNEQRARRMSIRTQLIAKRAGLDTRRMGADMWWLPDPEDPEHQEGSSVLWAGMGGSWTGEGIDGLLLIDDIIKGRKEAESPAHRQAVIDWFDDVADTRVHKDASIIVMATRWHPGDLSGVLIKRGWPYLNLRALAEEDRPEGDNREVGEALWPDRMPRERLEKKRKTNIFTFASLYQGNPRPRGGKIFKDAQFYAPHELPNEGYRVALGLDLNYSEKTSADFSVSLVGRGVGDLSEDGDGKIYLCGMEREQTEPPVFFNVMRLQAKRYRGGARWYFHPSGTERGTVQLAPKDLKPRIIVLSISGDKLVRALPAAEMWNEGRILLPDTDEDWVNEAIEEITNFTGVNDTQDDIVDSLASLVHGLAGRTTSAPEYESEYDEALPSMRM
jgi:predicted phage terminase large subunit-like protein